MVKLAGGTPVIVNAGFDQDFKMTAEQLENAITEKTKMLILCSPSNPTGSVYSKEELAALAEVLRSIQKYLCWQMKSTNTSTISASITALLRNQA